MTRINADVKTLRKYYVKTYALMNKFICYNGTNMNAEHTKGQAEQCKPQ